MAKEGLASGLFGFAGTALLLIGTFFAVPQIRNVSAVVARSGVDTAAGMTAVVIGYFAIPTFLIVAAVGLLFTAKKLGRRHLLNIDTVILMAVAGAAGWWLQSQTPA